MFTHHYSRLIATVGGLLASTIALAQDTSISYQGYVTTNSGGIIQGPTDYSMTFRLFDSAGGPTPLTGGIIGPITVSVEKSLFSVPLAFPTNLWTGADRWLEVQIGAEILTPRQKIRWVPYAIYALNAADRNSLDAADGTPADAVFVDASGFAGFGTTTPQARLHVQGDSFWLGGTDAAGFAAAAGPGMRFFNTPTESNINAADYSAGTPRPLVLQHQGGSVGIGGLPAAGNRLDVTGQVEMDAFKMATGAAAGRVLTSDANGVGTWQAASGGNGVWSTIGTADIANNNTGNVGIGTGTTAPANRLTVVDTQAGLLSIPLTISNTSSTAGTTTALNFRASGTSAPKAMLALERINTFGRGRFHFLLDNVGDDLPADLSDSRMSIDYFGNVGIGTGTGAPQARMHVTGETLSIPAAALENDDLLVEANEAVLGLYSSGASVLGSAIALKEINAGALMNTWGMYRLPTGNGAALRFSYGPSDNFAANPTRVQFNATGDVGIGTGIPSQRLHVREDVSGSAGIEIENRGTLGNSAITFRTVNGTTGQESVGSIMFSNPAIGDAGLFLDPAGGEVHVRSSRMTFGETGAAQGSSNFEIREPSGTLAMQLTANTEFDAGEIRMFGPNGTTQTIEIVAADGTGQGGGIAVRRVNGAEGIYLNGDESGGGAALYVYNATGGSPTIRLDGDYQGTGVGRVITDVLEITGADLAEKFPASEEIAPGMVVAIDVEHEGKLCLSRGAYNRTVAGVVSGAKDFSVGAILGSRTESADGPPIALAGRVYVWCDADAAPIKPGDLLTTSHVPGHAMRVLDHDAAQGAILGKAMGRLEQGRGLVLVLINLQ